MSASPHPTSQYRPDLDLIRFVAIILVHVHHVGLIFGPFWWIVKSPVELTVLKNPMLAAGQVRLPLILLISGVATAYAFRQRSLKALMGDRAKRLLVPLLFGVFFITPPQIYIERLITGRVQGSFLEFWPSVLEFVPWPKGSLSWHHLWLLCYLFLYNVLMLPLYAWLRTESAQRFCAAFEAWVTRGVNVWLLFLPSALIRISLDRYVPANMALINDYWLFSHLLSFFVLGNFLGRSPRFWDYLVEKRKVMMVVAVITGAAILPDISRPFWVSMMMYCLAGWSFMLAALAWARTLVTVTKPWLKYVRDRAFPFYILHELVLVVLAYPLLKLPMGPWVLFALITVVTILATWALTEFFFRVPFLRPLVGLKYRQSPRATVAEPQPALSPPAV
ncbi:acyltransferase family protein [Pyxidicoccus parkwayensis]|uniref:Acyltransferase family protein n=1 Tax=Pyxidicoccus parkwayensis TaxID=2813578 RepID=A0ABX7NYD5_9BACT|nr:acyltransferase family protein [Pyxidicoccus parkwaysis]QSQ23451.1 acyltransferase family protein [Pyxidicoccus parkwaysis]